MPVNKHSYKNEIQPGILANNVLAALFCCMVWLGAVASCPAQEKRHLSPGELQTELLKLSGGACVKLVWQQDENAIVTFDTKGATKRSLYSGPVGERSWPIITPDGSKVLFAITDLKANNGLGVGNIYAMDWNAPEGAALVELGDVPRMESIAPYTQALVVNEYEVVETLQAPKGASPLPAGSIIRLQEWGVRNEKAVARPRDVRFEPGQFNNRSVRVQRVADNPHLDTELVFDTLAQSSYAEVFFHPEPWIIERQN